MKKNGVCSKHLHKYKWNGFYVESGKMRVKVWQKDYDLVDETILEKGMYTKVNQDYIISSSVLKMVLHMNYIGQSLLTTILKENLWGSWVMNMTSYTTNFDHVKTFMKTFGQEVKDEPEFPTKETINLKN